MRRRPFGEDALAGFGQGERGALGAGDPGGNVLGVLEVGQRASGAAGSQWKGARAMRSGDGPQEAGRWKDSATLTP